MNKLRLLAISASTLLISTTALVACSDDTVVTPGGDAGIDSGTDAGADSSTDAATDAATDAGLTVDSFTTKVATTLCGATARCCFGSPDIPDGGAVDGGTYDPAVCLDYGKKLGFEFSSVGANDLTPSNVTLDQAKALECLDKIDSLSCSLTGSELRAARSACFAAIQGKVAIGQACKASIECVSGAYCSPSDAAVPYGGGECVELAEQGENCGNAFVGSNPDTRDDIDQSLAEAVCSTRGSGDTGLHCDSYDFAAGYRDRADWKCAPAVANGESCSATSWCATGICDPTDFSCKDPLELLAQACANLVKK